MASNAFDLILANPPFKGSLDYSDVHSSLTGKVKTKKTELLFITLMLRMLKQGGRCGVVVPDGVLFGSSNAHKSLRQLLVEQHQLEAVVKLPSGVFKPYAGVSTAILFFTKDGETTDVWFYDVQADGFSLDDKRDPIDESDLPDVREKWRQWSEPEIQTKKLRGEAVKKLGQAPRSYAKSLQNADIRSEPVPFFHSLGAKAVALSTSGTSRKAAADRKAMFSDRTARAFFVPKAEIAENGYDLSLNRYKEIVHEEEQYDSPKVILGRLKELEAEIAEDLAELEGMLR